MWRPFTCLFPFAVSDDMLPSDIEVVVRDGYHVSVGKYKVAQVK